LPFAVTAAAVLAAASAGLFYVASVSKRVPMTAGAVRVVVGADACDPDALTVPAGRRTFAIHNASSRPVEWEILDGVMVVEERENILPGFDQTLTANLKPGAYQITCGLLSNPRGTLTVLATAESDAAAKAGPDIKAFIGPLSEYKVFLALQGSGAVAAAEKLADAIKAGDLDAARALYVPARAPYRRVEAVVARWSDLQNSIDPAADYLQKREQDPSSTGYHRLEYGLFAQGSTEGLAPAAEKLAADMTDLKARLRAVKLTPADLTEGTARLARRLAEGKVATGENAYARTDLEDLAASLEGLAKATRLILPLLPAAASSLESELEQRLEAAGASLARLKIGDTYPPYDKVDAPAREVVADAFRNLADTLDKVSAQLSVDQS
jgi:iron uptake system EfeUOB component EfeO/EfeM